MRWRGAALTLSVAALSVSAARAQSCEGVRGGRVAAIGGTNVAGWALAAAFHPREWWQGDPGTFRFNWSAGPSPAVGQDYLLHVAATYQVSQAAALAWEWACVPRGTAVWLGAATAFAVGLPKKVVDGFHHTGFEVAKNLANGVGALLPVVQQTWPATRAGPWIWPSSPRVIPPTSGTNSRPTWTA